MAANPDLSAPATSGSILGQIAPNFVKSYAPAPASPMPASVPANTSAPALPPSLTRNSGPFPTQPAANPESDIVNQAVQDIHRITNSSLLDDLPKHQADFLLNSQDPQGGDTDFTQLATKVSSGVPIKDIEAQNQIGQLLNLSSDVTQKAMNLDDSQFQSVLAQLRQAMSQAQQPLPQYHLQQPSLAQALLTGLGEVLMPMHAGQAVEGTFGGLKNLSDQDYQRQVQNFELGQAQRQAQLGGMERLAGLEEAAIRGKQQTLLSAANTMATVAYHLQNSKNQQLARMGSQLQAWSNALRSPGISINQRKSIMSQYNGVVDTIHAATGISYPMLPDPNTPEGQRFAEDAHDAATAPMQLKATSKWNDYLNQFLKTHGDITDSDLPALNKMRQGFIDQYQLKDDALAVPQTAESWQKTFQKQKEADLAQHYGNMDKAKQAQLRQTDQRIAQGWAAVQYHQTRLAQIAQTIQEARDQHDVTNERAYWGMLYREKAAADREANSMLGGRSPLMQAFNRTSYELEGERKALQAAQKSGDKDAIQKHSDNIATLEGRHDSLAQMVAEMQSRLPQRQNAPTPPQPKPRTVGGYTVKIQPAAGPALPPGATPQF